MKTVKQLIAQNGHDRLTVDAVGFMPDYEKVI